MPEKMVCQESNLSSMAAERNTTAASDPAAWTDELESGRLPSEFLRRLLSNEHTMYAADESGTGCENPPPARPEIFPSAFWIPDMIEQYEENPLGHEPEIERVIDRGQALPVKLPKFGISALQGSHP